MSTSGRPPLPDRQNSEHRKRRLTDTEPARRSYPYPQPFPHDHRSQLPGWSNSSRDGGRQVGNRFDTAIDRFYHPRLSHNPQPPPPHPLRHGSMSRRQNQVPPILPPHFQQASRRVSEISVPRWQPDFEVDECPVCQIPFGFLNRRHHCRKCGRVVCGTCSTHRITIPREYIVTQDGSISAAGGGQEVRVCNPCVPDPWTPPVSTGVHAAIDRRSHVLDDGRRRPEAFHRTVATSERSTGAASPVNAHSNFGNSNNLPQQPPQQPQQRPAPFTFASDAYARRNLNFGTQSPMSFNNNRISGDGDDRHPPPPNLRNNETLPIRNRVEPQGLRHGDPRAWSVTPEEFANLMRHGAPVPGAPVPTMPYGSLPPAGTAPRQTSAARPIPAAPPVLIPTLPPQRLMPCEDDECPVCGHSMPAGPEEIREAHIRSCIAERFATSASSSATGTPAGTRPRASTFQARGIVTWIANEKDCTPDDEGTAPECVICLDEFQPGDRLARMECWCKFHSVCLRQWWETKPESCPTHRLTENN